MRLPTSLLVLLLAASAVGCHHRRHARYALDDDGAAPPLQQPIAQEEQPPQGAVEEPPVAEDTTPPPEVPQAPPPEVIAETEPPEPVYEERTPQAVPDTVWVPGYWHPEELELDLVRGRVALGAGRVRLRRALLLARRPARDLRARLLAFGLRADARNRRNAHRVRAARAPRRLQQPLPPPDPAGERLAARRAPRAALPARFDRARCVRHASVAGGARERAARPRAPGALFRAGAARADAAGPRPSGSGSGSGPRSRSGSRSGSRQQPLEPGQPAASCSRSGPRRERAARASSAGACAHRRRRASASASSSSSARPRCAVSSSSGRPRCAAASSARGSVCSRHRGEEEALTTRRDERARTRAIRRAPAQGASTESSALKAFAFTSSTGVRKEIVAGRARRGEHEIDA